MEKVEVGVFARKKWQVTHTESLTWTLKNGWLEDYFPFGNLGHFSGAMSVDLQTGYFHGNVPIFMMIPNLYIKTWLFYETSILNWCAVGCHKNT